uniref:Recep_L_domain domain-containing protein n=1 Tax=Caenorhabditis tropicalis TaxID=1561998 RepID=A0A1I7UEK2_9PELO
MWFFLILLFINTILLQAALSPADTFFKKKNCDSQCIFNKELSLESISSFPTNCSRVCTFLSLNEYSGINESKLTNLFKNVKVLIGGLSVSNTAFTSLKFLAPLEGIECSDDVGINIQNNNEMVDTGLINLKTIDCPTIFISAGFQMTGLNVPKLERITYNLSQNIGITIMAPLDTFCITPIETRKFLSTRSPSLIGIVTAYCKPKNDSKLCNTPAEGCVEIYGNVVIGPTFDMSLMKNVEAIYGCLIINGTSLSNLNAFEKLHYVAHLSNGKPAIRIENNLLLTNATFPMLKRVYSNTIDEIIFKNNSEELLLDPFLCYGLRNVLSMDNEDAPTFDGETCEQVEKSAPERNVTYMDGKSKSATMVNNFHECFDFLVSVVIFVVTQL